MKKYFISFLLLLIAPSMCLGASARYTQLVREKQRKMEQLEKCMGASKGLKIAGVSTIGLTAVGVAANIAEAKTIKTNEKVIEKKKKEIESAQTEIAKKKADAKILAECKKALRDNNITRAEKDEDGTCIILDCEDGYGVSENGKSCIKKTVSPSDKQVVLIVMDEDPEAYKAYNFDGTCDVDGDEDQNVSSCSGLSKGGWSATFSYGEVKGTGLCSTTSGEEYKPGVPSNTIGENCWCQITSGPKGTSSWVFNYDFGSEEPESDEPNCNTDCVSYCVDDFANYEELRIALFDYESE